MNRKQHSIISSCQCGSTNDSEYNLRNQDLDAIFECNLCKESLYKCGDCKLLYTNKSIACFCYSCEEDICKSCMKINSRKAYHCRNYGQKYEKYVKRHFQGQRIIRHK